jgi:outer membrane protein insertion porin family
MRALPLLVWLVAAPALAQTDHIGLPIVELRVEDEGRPVTDRTITDIIETKIGSPLSMRQVRESIDHIYGLGRFDDVQVLSERGAAGVILRYVLFPTHAIQRVEFRGPLGIPESDLRQAMTERFGPLPAVGRVPEVIRAFQAIYRDRGFVQARVDERIDVLHDPDRAILIFTITAGLRASIRRVDVEGLEGPDRATLLAQLGVGPGRSYDSVEIQQRLEKFQASLRGHGYYEARAMHTAEFTPEREADVDVVVERGPHVTVAFDGDALPKEARDQLVPVQREGSVDEDLLEDAGRAIEDYLHQRGYRDADVEHMRAERDGELIITFHVSRGARHVADDVQVKGNVALTTASILELLRIKPGEPFVQATLDNGVGALRSAYRTRGFTRAAIEPVVSILPRQAGSGPNSDRRVLVALNVTEGTRTLVGSIAIQGNTVLTEAQIRSVMTTTIGQPYSEVQVVADRDRIQLEYLNRGYQSAVVDPEVTLAENDTRANVRIAVSEGPQVLIDHVIIVGNERTRAETIERELRIRSGGPLGYSAMLESQQRLSALGLFRRVRLTELRHGSQPRRDVLVQVEEAPPTSIGVGGGIEGGQRLRPTAEGGVAEERYEVAPRAFFEVGRRNLFGKNRSVNLFTRVSLRARDIVFSDEGVRLDTPDPTTSSYGFNEYRVVGQYREPKVLNTPADVLVTGILDQAIRSSFNFITREARAEMAWRVSPRYGMAARYSYEHTRLFDERFSEDEKPLIDRLFPQVRLSMFTFSVYRDTTDDVIDPVRGTFLGADNDIAARAIGSEVGFVKTFLQAKSFHRLPARRRMVLALAARVGMAHGFRRSVAQVTPAGAPVLGPDGQPVVDIVDELPASERFFAGGDTTVRGFSLDRLGDERTISPSGFPIGGNGVIVLNAELRMALIRGVGVVGFVDAGNVVPFASDIDFTDQRVTSGFGFRYRSPVGPIRVDLGFKLDRRELVPGNLERRWVLHVSLGQAF